MDSPQGITQADTLKDHGLVLQAVQGAFKGLLLRGPQTTRRLWPLETEFSEPRQA